MTGGPPIVMLHPVPDTRHVATPEIEMGGTSGVPGGQIARWSWGMTLLAWNPGTAPVSARIGEVDARFGNHGVLQIGSAQVARVLQMSEGKLLSVDLNRSNVEITRYLASEVPDSTFGDSGMRFVQLPAKNEPVLGDAQLQPDGKIVLVGAGDAGPSAPVKVVIEPTTPDNTSGDGGSGRSNGSDVMRDARLQ